MQQAPENDRAAVDGREGHSLAAAGPAVAPVNWISPTEFRLDGLSFTCDAASYGNRATDKQRIIIAKDRSIIDALYEHLSPGKPQTMLEIGIAQGGSAFLHTSLFRLSKYVGLDLRGEDATVLTLLNEKYGSNRVKLYYETSQTDKPRIAQICKEEFGGLCDVVIDDGSHQYDLSVQTLEVALPHVRPGGFYIIEDWSWAHWPGAKWQDRQTGYNIDKPALSNLVFELTMLCASRPDILSHGLIKKGFTAFRRGPSELDWQTFKVSESYLTQGRSFVRL
jgi:cephalosporin hydroxylase